MVDYDFAPRGPLRIGIASDDTVDWLPSGDAIRVRGADLREVAGRAAAARRKNPGAAVVVDIEFVIAADERSARALAPAGRGSRHGQTILYIGTPAGLAGLISDIRAVDIADGAVVIPLAPGGAAAFRDSVLPVLDTMVSPSSPAGERTA